MNHEPDLERDDSLGRLIQRAGRRAEPPELMEAQVRRAVHAEWQRVAGRRRRRNIMIFATAATVAFAAVGIGVLRQLPPAAGGEPVARIVRAVGEVRIIEPGHLERRIGAPPYAQPLRAGEEIVTGAVGGVNVMVGGEVSVRVGPRSRLRWVNESRARLLAGAVYVDSPPRDGVVPLAGKFNVETEFGRVAHVGTQYLVIASADAMSVRVREGLVIVEAEGTREVARATEEVTIDRNGAVGRARLDRDGPDWGWVEALAAGFDVANRSLLEFLEWVARETGRTLQFADERAREEARTTILQGSTRGLTVGQALDSVMATTNLTATVTGDRLLVARR